MEDSLASTECPFSTVVPSYLREKTSERAASKPDTDNLDTVMRDLRRDIYIIEAYNILHDLTGGAEKEKKH